MMAVSITCGVMGAPLSVMGGGMTPHPHPNAGVSHRDAESVVNSLRCHGCQGGICYYRGHVRAQAHAHMLTINESAPLTPMTPASRLPSSWGTGRDAPDSSVIGVSPPPMTPHDAFACLHYRAFEGGI